MASFSSLWFLVSTFRLWGGSCWIGGITFFLGTSGTSVPIFYDPCLYPYLTQSSCLCCSLNFCCCIPSPFQCLSLNCLEACISLCLLKNLSLIMHVLTLVLFNIDTNRIIFVYQCPKLTLRDFLSIHCRCWITNYAWPCLDLRSKN